MEQISKRKIANYLIAVAVGFLAALVIISPDDKVQILKGDRVLSVVTDTVYIPKPYPIVYTKEVEVKVPYEVTKLDTVYMVNTTSRYRDTVEVEKDYQLTYDAKVTGKLDKITLGYVDNRPTQVIKETTTETIVKQPKGLYIGGTTSLDLTTSVGAQYVNNRNIIGLSVNINSQPLTNPTKYNITYYRRLF